MDFGHTVHVVVSTRGSRRGGDVAGAILDPQSTVGNKQIRPLLLFWWNVVGGMLVPVPALNFCELENGHQALLGIVERMK